ncbi:MAG: type VI secretion system accessory protein TagJ [Planctomycetota bacterium]|nr:type VI secretion system accessory protein TagJ [Planctomycetota bacterium]
MTPDSASQLLNQGRLRDAIESATAAVRSDASNPGHRWPLAELLCFESELERADKQTQLLGDLEPKWVPGVVVFRHLIRAATWRRDVFDSGRVPEFFGKPPPVLQDTLKALVDLRAGDVVQAAESLRQLERERVATPGLVDDVKFAEWRDLDDLCASFLEVFYPGGIYAWVAWENIESLELLPIKRPRDLLWRPAKISVFDGPSKEVHVPCVYEGTVHSGDENLKLGWSTAWTSEPGHPVRGLGQKLFAADGAEPAIREISHLRFDHPVSLLSYEPAT